MTNFGTLILGFFYSEMFQGDFTITIMLRQTLYK